MGSESSSRTSLAANTKRLPKVRVATAVPTPDWHEGSPNKGLQTFDRSKTKTEVLVDFPKRRVI